jgi:hypothetical protein
MPITAFPGFDDGLEAGSRRRDHFISDLALIYVDEDGAFAMYEDGFSMLELAREYYRSEGLDLSHIDAMIC